MKINNLTNLPNEGGGHLYEHHLSIKCIAFNVEESAGVTKQIGTVFITIALITNDSTQITTFESLNNALSSYICPCLTGAINDSSGNSIKVFFESIEKFTGTGSQRIKVYYINSEFSHLQVIANFDKVTDNVVQIL